MEHVSVDDIDTVARDVDGRCRTLTGALGTTDLSINHYRLAPGERFSGSLHAHFDQEEVFVVLSGTATFETREATATVADGEAIRFEPGEFQTGWNDGDEPVVALGLGAPRESEDVRIARIDVLDDLDVSCPDCETDHMSVAGDDVDADLVCPECDATMDPV